MRRFVTILFAMAIVVAACGGGTDDPGGVASLNDQDAPQSTTSTTRLDADVALLQFSQCMRDEGIELPDIGIDADGAPILDPALLDTIDVASDEFTSAFDTCQPILEQSTAFDIDLDPELQAQIQDQLVMFSQCMRNNGFDDFPDPNPINSGPVYPISVLAQFDDPGFEDAVELCQRDLAFPGLDG